MYKYSLPYLPFEFNKITDVFKFIEDYTHNNTIDPGEEELKQSYNEYYEKKPEIIRKLKSSINYIAKLKAKEENHPSIRIEIEKNKKYLISKNCYLPLMAEKIRDYTYLNLNIEDHAKLYTEHKLLVKIVEEIIPLYNIESLGFVEPPSNSKIKRYNDRIEMCNIELSKPICTARRVYYEGEISKLRDLIEIEAKEGFLNYSPKQYIYLALHLTDRSRCSFSLLRGVIHFHLSQQFKAFRTKESDNKLKKKNKYKIWEWRRQNPNGNKTQCAKEISLSRSTVIIYWNYSPEGV